MTCDVSPRFIVTWQVGSRLNEWCMPIQEDHTSWHGDLALSRIRDNDGRREKGVKRKMEEKRKEKERKEAQGRNVEV